MGKQVIVLTVGTRTGVPTLGTCIRVPTFGTSIRVPSVGSRFGAPSVGTQTTLFSIIYFVYYLACCQWPAFCTRLNWTDSQQVLDHSCKPSFMHRSLQLLDVRTLRRRRRIRRRHVKFNNNNIVRLFNRRHNAQSAVAHTPERLNCSHIWRNH